MSVSSSENRQLRSLPSEVSRMRLQLMQNGRLTDAMKPTRPPPSAYRNRAPVHEGPDRPTGTSGPILAVEDVEDVGREQDLLALPLVAGVERHVLDEPQLQPVLAGRTGPAGRRRPRSRRGSRRR